jgi:hypothetical protein
MAKQSNLKIKVMEQKYQCKYCSKKFHKEVTLSTHVCVKKRRHMDKDTAGSRIGFNAYQRFYEISASSKKPKSIDEFINSPYYIEFVKFGNHLASLKPIHIDKYIDFVIKNSVKLKDWCKDFVYDVYITDLVKKEPPVSATDRTITNIVLWCEASNIPFGQFFRCVSPNEAAYMIRTGKISPWVLYLASSGEHLISSFNEDHSKMIGDIIDPNFWMKKFKKDEEEVDFIKTLLDQAGL